MLHLSLLPATTVTALAQRWTYIDDFLRAFARNAARSCLNGDQSAVGHVDASPLYLLLLGEEEHAHCTEEESYLAQEKEQADYSDICPQPW